MAPISGPNPIAERSTPSGADPRLEDDGFGLMVRSRDRFSTCVQAIHGVAIDDQRARQTVEAAVASLTTLPIWRATSYGKAPPVVEAGCSSPSILERGGTLTPDGVAVTWASLEVQTASKHRLLIFVLPVQEIARGFGSGSMPRSRHLQEETLCIEEGRPEKRCAYVTNGLYLTPCEVADMDTVADGIYVNLGLWRQAYPRPTPSSGPSPTPSAAVPPPAVVWASGASLRPPPTTCGTAGEQANKAR